MQRSIILVSILCLATLPCIADGVAPIEGLLGNSPFGQPKINAVTSATIPLEFRAVLEENGHLFFSLFETPARRSLWIKLHAQGPDISAEKYDASAGMLTVNYHGSTLTLPLKGSSFVAQIVSPVIQNKSDNALPVANEAAIDSPYHDRPFRVGHVVEEMHIRQAVRDNSEAIPDL